MALGAPHGLVLRLIVREGMMVAAIGIGVGLAGALSLSWVLASLVFDVQVRDPLTFVAVAMSLAAVAQKTGVTAVAPVLHRPPEMIQELTWQPPDGVAASPPRDSVRKVLLSFFNGELFRIAVSYEWERTEGLTVEDMIAALSSTYGPPITPNSELIPLLSRSSAGSDKIVAHWEDPQYSVNLVRPSYASTFGLVMLSKRLDALVRAAMVEAIWLDDQQANRDKAVAIAAGREYFNQDPNILRFVMENPTDRVTYGDLRMIRSEFEELMELSLAAGTIKHAIPYETYVDDSFARSSRPAAIAL